MSKQGVKLYIRGEDSSRGEEKMIGGKDVGNKRAMYIAQSEALKAEYNSSAPTATDGAMQELQTDVNGNLMATLATGLDKDNDGVTVYPANGTPVNLAASGQILAGPGKILGFYVNSTNAGTLRISDALTATTPYLGAAATPAIGWHQYPANLSTGGYVTIAGTALDVTFFVIPD